MFSKLSSPNLSYRTLRALHICIVFTFTIWFQEILRFPRAGWVGFAVMMIYAGFDSGTTLFRAYHRFWGMLLGLFSGYLLWFMGHLDYRTLILIIPLTVFFAYFLVGHAYSVPTAFTVNTAVIGTGYFYAHNSFSITFFLVDYAICTVFAFVIILLFEYFWFRRHHMMQRFIRDTQNEVLQHLSELVNLLNQDKIQRTKWYHGCVALNRSLNEVNNLVRNAQFLHSSEQAVGDEFNYFVALSNRIFVALKALYSAYYTKRYHKHDYFDLYNQVQADLAQLASLLEHKISINSGVIHEAHN